ncbi:MAG: HEAT repeat domain-containing protein [Candidatus Binatia bacterium]
MREGIAAKLGQLAKSGEKRAQMILEQLAIEPANPAVRVAALNALRKASVGLPAMLGSLEAENRWVRLAAVDGLAALRAPDAVSPLARRVHDSDPQIRFAALKALFAIGGPEADAALDRAREESSPEARAVISRAAELAAKR